MLAASLINQFKTRLHDESLAAAHGPAFPFPCCAQREPASAGGRPCTQFASIAGTSLQGLQPPTGGTCAQARLSVLR